MSETLGKAVLELEANLAQFEKNMHQGKRTSDEMQHALDAVASVARVAEIQLNQVKLDAATGARSNEIADRIERSIGGVGAAAAEASRRLEQVKLDASNAAESAVSAERIDRSLKNVTGNANEARRALESVRLAGVGAGGSGPAGRSGVGVGAFGSGYGRIGLLGTAIGAGVLTGPVAGPAALGMLAAIPAFAGAAVGALGTLALAFDGVGKAIGGDKKAYDDLTRSQKQFVLQVRSLDTEFRKLKETAAESMFPGLTAGLHAAMSPATLAAVTKAVQEFGTAMGQAGAAWGQYFGSAAFQHLFGPLMESGARNLGVMSEAALRLFDALGVLGRAGIPLANWMSDAAARGAQLADHWMRAKDASGALAHAMDESKTALRLLGDLVVALGRAVGALGEALYPVSKVAVKDLTDGLNALAGIIQRNQGVIREIVGGALDALVGAVKTAADGVRELRAGLGHIVGDKATIVTAIIAIGTAISLSMGPEAAAITGAVAAIGLIRQNWQEFGDWFTAFSAKVIQNSAIIQAFSHLPGSMGAWARQLKGNAGLNLQTAQANASGQHVPLSQMPSAVSSKYGWAMSPSLGREYAAARAQMLGFSGDQVQMLDRMYAYEDGSGSPGDYGRFDGGRFVAMKAGTPGGQYTSFGPFQLHAGGQLPAWVWAKGPAFAQQWAWSRSGINYALNARLQHKSLSGNDFAMALAKHQGSSNIQAEYAAILGSTYSPTPPPVDPKLFGTVPDWTKNLGPKPTQPTGDALLPQKLRDAIQKAKDNATTSQGAVAARWLHTELDHLEAARKLVEDKIDGGAKGKQLAALKNEARSIDGRIAEVNKHITTNLRQQAQAIKTEFQSKISTAKSAISAAMSTLKSALDEQFRQHTQDYIDNILGPKYFQGTDANGLPLQTESEKRLADMQREDQRKSIKDAIDQAQAQLDSDRASTTASTSKAAQDAYNNAAAALDAAKAAGKDAATIQELQTALNNARAQLNDVLNQGASPQQIKADQDALDAAKRSLDEYELQQTAAKERAQADHDYAEAVKQYQRERSDLEREMNARLDTFGKGLADGTTHLSDLDSIVGEFGLSLISDGGIVDDFTTLGDAVQGLAKVMLHEALRLSGVGDATDSESVRKRAEALGLDAVLTQLTLQHVAAGGEFALPGIPGGAGAGNHSVGHRELPMLDVGGEVLQTGLAIVHRGESYSGINGEHWRSGGIHFHGGTFIGGDKHQVARDLKPYLDRVA